MQKHQEVVTDQLSGSQGVGNVKVADLPRCFVPWPEELGTNGQGASRLPPNNSQTMTGGEVAQSLGLLARNQATPDNRWEESSPVRSKSSSIVPGSVIGGHYMQHTIRVPKRVVHEEVVEKTIVVPETIRREEIVEMEQTVQERVIEVAKPVVTEEILEVPEVVYVDKIIEVPHIVVQEKLVRMPKIEVQERIHKVHKIIPRERVVEVPEIEYQDVIVEKIIEVPEIYEQIQVRENLVPRYLVREVPEYIKVERPYDVPIKVPVPMQCTSVVEYEFPTLVPRVVKYKYPVYLPRFVEVPVAQHPLATEVGTQLQLTADRIALLKNMTDPVSLCEVETLATAVKEQLEAPDATRALAFGEALVCALTHPGTKQGSVSVPAAPSQSSK